MDYSGFTFPLHKTTKPWKQSFVQLVITSVYNTATVIQLNSNLSSQKEHCLFFNGYAFNAQKLRILVHLICWSFMSLSWTLELQQSFSRRNASGPSRNSYNQNHFSCTFEHSNIVLRQTRKTSNVSSQATGLYLVIFLYVKGTWQSPFLS